MTAAMAAGALGLLVPGLARAHFTLNSPMNWAQQGSLGVPEKSAPCGQADPGTAAVATGIVTTYRPGQKITVSITEDVPHPGFYRAVLSQNGMNGLPMDPMVTPASTAPNDACGTATSATTFTGLTPQTPSGALLVDGALKHNAAFTGAQTFDVTLPSNVTCTNCVLQIEEFMSNHGLNNPGGCFYHHCANIAIQGTPVDGGMSGGTDAGSDAKAGGSGGATGTGMGGKTGTGGSSAGVGGMSGGTAGMSGGTAGMSGGGEAGMSGGSTAGMSGGSTAGTSGGTAGMSGRNGTGGSKNNDSSGGCSIASGASGSAASLVGLLIAVVLIRRRRRA